ncbi:sensor histidine kinase [Actinomadura verrucosospora]|uniref:histidine kinase n=1 Tax=Actinomadura verrucosospora TaxID=46165 RepID=A0A7D4AR75_ACTVE|nr:HAMP domain-containing sensor histidine kinase [Actinomadura verrucosospora]QKG23089.1 signal transduction histidine kinase-like protein [Actinomadura verrucosospora]
MRQERAERARYWRNRLLVSVRGRATVITVAVTAVFLTVILVLGMLLVRDWLESRQAAKAERTAERIAFDIVQGRITGTLSTRPGESGMVQIVSADGTQVLAATPQARGKPPFASAGLSSGDLLVDHRSCPRSIPGCAWIFGLRMRTSPWGPGVMVVAAEPLPSLLNVWGLPLTLTVVLLALLSLVTWWTWHTIGRAFAPIDRIRAELGDLDARDLRQRVFVPRTHGEIQALGETVNATLERLEEATDRERRFVSDASHDLRNPIAGLHLQLEMALDEVDEETRPLIASALRDAERLNDIVIDLLELSRLDSRVPQPVEPVDLAETARREVDRRGDGVRITARLEPGVIVRANPVRIARVLGNLLSNAERHAESGVEVTVRRDGATALLQVEDDGHGIAPDQRERVFERFARLTESRERDPQGTGLGLPIAREIAEIYGGSLTIADSERGARFVMRLPLAADGGSGR